MMSKPQLLDWIKSYIRNEAMEAAVERYSWDVLMNFTEEKWEKYFQLDGVALYNKLHPASTEKEVIVDVNLEAKEED
ncbi:hypothetical protein ROZALSC1DRAFT_27464, partial [Rozella allomycis CSF55]